MAHAAISTLGRLPFHQGKRQADVPRLSVGCGDPGDKDFRREPPGFIQILAYRRQVHETGQVDVVKSHNGEIFGNPQVRLARSLDDTDRLDI